MANSRWARRLVAAAVLGTASSSTLVITGQTAQAQPVTITNLGTFQIPDNIQVPTIPGLVQPGSAAAPGKTVGAVALDAALSKLGAPYRYGAAGPNAFDCSGLVQWSYRQAGRQLPRTSGAQLAAGIPIARDNLQPGDLVSFYGGEHSAIYAGNGNIVHAATSGQPVKISPLGSMPFTGARRF